jgi:hypothetical protein
VEVVDERRIYKTLGGLACKVEVTGHHTCVKCTDSGVWPLVHPTEPKIKVTIGRLVRRKRK